MTFTWLFFLICLTELILLSVGFCPIGSRIYDLYDKIRDPILLVPVSHIRSGLVGAVAIIALIDLGLIYATALRVHEDFLYAISHVFLTLCAVLCVVVSTSTDWQIQERPGDFLKSWFEQAGAAVIMFELGCGFLVSAMFTALERPNREEAIMLERSRAGA